MTPTEVAATLRQFNEWRRGDYEPSEQPAPPDPIEIGEAIDAAIEMIDRLEAAEKSDAESLAMYRRVRDERDNLRAKLAEMEKQEPLDAGSDVFRSAFEAALKAGNWPATRQGDGYRSPSTQIAWRIAFSTVNRLKLYIAPGAQPAPSVPRESIERMLTQLMDIAVSNGANSLSMPDEYVEVAAWLCGIPAQPAPSVPDGWRLVPIVSTHEMKEAGACAGAVYYAIAKDVWSAMLAAAPEAKP